MLERLTIPAPARATLRALGAREGWLIETPERLRVGFGGVLARIPLAQGLNSTGSVYDSLREIDVFTESGADTRGAVGFGTLPFRRDAPSHLYVPRYVIELGIDLCEIVAPAGDTDWQTILENVELPQQDVQTATARSFQPTGEEYAHAVAHAVGLLRRHELDKVVLARCVRGSTDNAIDAGAVAQRLRSREPAATIYALSTEDGARFIGASPELLVCSDDDTAKCHPLAGTIAVSSAHDASDYHQWLLGSSKNRLEHSLVVDDLVRSLSQEFAVVEKDEPSIVALRTVAHLGTWITARAPYTSLRSLDLVARLHPTAAVGGLPRDEAYELLQRLEGADRGHYAGPVGWTDARGHGEWWVGIRGVVVSSNTFEAWAGAGIVSESEPAAEREETRHKLSVAMSSVVLEAP